MRIEIRFSQFFEKLIKVWHSAKKDLLLATVPSDGSFQIPNAFARNKTALPRYSIATTGN
jgi:hypothetical protein